MSSQPNEPGPGFFALAREPGGLARTPSAAERLTFWKRQVSAPGALCRRHHRAKHSDVCTLEQTGNVEMRWTSTIVLGDLEVMDFSFGQ